MQSAVLEPEAECQVGVSDVIRRLLGGASWNLLAVSFTQGVTFLTNVLIARVLGKSAFGQYAVVQGSLVTAVGLLQTSMGGTAAKYVAEFRNTQPGRAAAILRLCGFFTLLMSCLGAIALAIGAPWFAISVYRMPHLMFGFYAGIVFLFFSTLNSFQMGALWGLESYRTLSVASATSGLATLLIVAVAVWKFGLAGAFVAMSAGAVIRWALHARTLRTALRTHGISFERIHLRSAVPVVLRFALPSALCGCISLPAMWIAQALLARQTDGFSYVGTYAAANNIRLLVLFLPQVLNTVGVSILNNHRHQAPAMYRLVHRSNVIAMALTNLTVALLAAFACRPLLGLFGKNFAGDASILLILLASTVPESISMGLHQHIQAQERMWQVFLAINLPREGLVLSAAFFLVPTHGAQGLAISYLLGALLALIAYTLLVRQNDRAPAIGQLETS